MKAEKKIQQKKKVLESFYRLIFCPQKEGKERKV
jgi:hypothetical protein